MIHLDTHTVVWLAAGDLDRFGPFVLPLLQQRGCALSPMVVLELDYLHEIERLKLSGAALIQALKDQIGLVVDGSPFSAIIA